MLSHFIENLTWPSQPFTVISQFFLKIKHCKNCNSHIIKIHRHKLTMAAIVNVNVNSNVIVGVCFSSLFSVFLYFCPTHWHEPMQRRCTILLLDVVCQQWRVLITLITYNVSILLLGVAFLKWLCLQKKDTTLIMLIIYHFQYLPGFALINILQIFLLPKSKWVLFVRDRIRAPSPEKEKR